MDCCGLSSTGLQNIDANKLTSDNATIYSSLNVSGYSFFNNVLASNNSTLLSSLNVSGFTTLNNKTTVISSHYTFYTRYFTGRCSPKNIRTAGISPTQGAFCSVQLSGDWTHQVKRCAASILQSVSCEAVPWQSSIGPRHDKASGYR